MTKKYEAPQIEVIEIEIEGLICASGGNDIETTTYGNSLGSRASSSRTSTM